MEKGVFLRSAEREEDFSSPNISSSEFLIEVVEQVLSFSFGMIGSKIFRERAEEDVEFAEEGEPFHAISCIEDRVCWFWLFDFYGWYWDGKWRN
jgi:hypothetical protein